MKKKKTKTKTKQKQPKGTVEGFESLELNDPFEGEENGWQISTGPEAQVHRLEQEQASFLDSPRLRQILDGISVPERS